MRHVVYTGELAVSTMRDFWRREVMSHDGLLHGAYSEVGARGGAVPKDDDDEAYALFAAKAHGVAPPAPKQASAKPAHMLATAERVALHGCAKASECNALWAFLKHSAVVPPWHPDHSFVAFNHSADGGDATTRGGRGGVEAARAAFGAGREPLYYEGSAYERAAVLHVPAEGGDGKSNVRLLCHFYTFLQFADAARAREMRAWVRDHLHYVDEIFCVASRVVAELRRLARAAGARDGGFSTMHVRRGEFQYKNVKVDAHKIADAVRGVFRSSEVVYVATDEKNRSFFEPLRLSHANAGYRLVFMRDVAAAARLDGVEGNWLGMVDQIVASHGRTFFGTWFSTFSGYIVRMRGYLGHADNTTYYYAPPEKRLAMHVDTPPHFPYYMREWPTAWRELDGAEPPGPPPPPKPPAAAHADHLGDPLEERRAAAALPPPVQKRAGAHEQLAEISGAEHAAMPLEEIDSLQKKIDAVSARARAPCALRDRAKRYAERARRPKRRRR